MIIKMVCHEKCASGDNNYWRDRRNDNLPATSKATKYEHMLPKLAEIEMDKDIKGVLFIMNTLVGMSVQDWHWQR